MNGPPLPLVTILPKGVGRLRAGHPWVYRTDVEAAPDTQAGLVHLADQRGRPLGTALWSPHSEIRVRWLARAGEPVDQGWWRAHLRHARDRRRAIRDSGHRVVHAEGDGLPSLIVDRYGDVVVAQFLSAGLEAVRDDIVTGMQEVLEPRGLLLRNDVPVRERERLPRVVEPVAGDVPHQVAYTEGALRLVAAPWTGQKTGAFLDQRENHQAVGALAAGKRGLDVCCYQGGFALQMLRAGATSVTAVDSSADALAAFEEAAASNRLDGVREVVEANAFDWLRAAAAAGERWDVIALDPPAFAKDKRSVPRALAGYKELNLRAMQCLAPGGWLFTASCSFHVHRGDFFAMLADAAADAGRRLQLVEIRGAAPDHPELLTVPETGYLKGALLREG